MLKLDPAMQKEYQEAIQKYEKVGTSEECPCNEIISKDGNTPASWGSSPSDDRPPRLRWKLGRIQEIFKEWDGLVRSALVKTSQGVVRRPITRC